MAPQDMHATLASQREPPRPRARWLVVGRAAGARLAPLQELREVPGVAIGVIH